MILYDRPVWPQGYDRPEGGEAVPRDLDWDLWLGTATARSYRGNRPKDHPVYTAAVEVVETSGMRREMYPEWSIVRWEWPQRGVRPPLKIYWYDGGKLPPESITGGGRGGLIWIGTKGSLPQGRGPFRGQDWVVAVKAGKQAPCHFGYAGPFTEAYQLANVALRVGHRIEWDALAFRVTNCREANQYLSREYRRGWELKEIAGSAYL
jgi:hypothetical protein